LITCAQVRYDCSKLDQWEIVFEHAERLGLHLHFKTQETEVDNEPAAAFDGSGAVGRERRLYIRELMARYSHHLVLNWNLGEENTQTTQQQIDMANAFREFDPYDHHVVLHTHPGDAVLAEEYTPHLGTGTLSGISAQIYVDSIHSQVELWVRLSGAAGQQWVVSNDEQGGANTGILPDDSYPSVDAQYALVGKVLYGTFMAGGAGVEAYFG